MNNILSAAVQRVFGSFLTTRKMVADDKVKFCIHWVERFLAWHGPVSNLADDPAAYPVFSTNSAGKRNRGRSTRPVTQSGSSFFSGKQSPRLRTRQSLPSRMSQPTRRRGTNWPRKWSAFSGWNISRCK